MKSLRNHPHVVGLIGHCIEKGALFMFSYHISFCCSFLFFGVLIFLKVILVIEFLSVPLSSPFPSSFYSVF